jgi:hypothetical protein
MNFIDDDENVTAMRETAREVGLAGVLTRAFHTRNSQQKQELTRQALRLLGVERVTQSRPRVRRLPSPTAKKGVTRPKRSS